MNRDTDFMYDVSIMPYVSVNSYVLRAYKKYGAWNFVLFSLFLPHIGENSHSIVWNVCVTGQVE